MAEITHRQVATNGIDMHIADAGFHAVAPDQRGYGETDAPQDIAAYAMVHLVGDVVGLIAALNETRAVVVGHDWGAPVAWTTALFRPDIVSGVVGLSVPFRPRGSRPPLEVYRKVLGERFYQVYFQEPGVAERDLERDVRRTIRVFLFAASGDAPELADAMVGDEGWVAVMAE